MRHFSAADCEALFDAILVNDVVDAMVELPPSIRVDYLAEHLADGFAISRQVWREGFDRDALIAFIAKLRRGEPITADDQIWFKHVRAKFKHLRFAFVLYGADHLCPRMFKSVTTSMGLLQDAFRNGQRGATVRQSAILRTMLSRLPLKLLDREVHHLKHSDAAGFREFTLDQIADLRATLAKRELTGHRFHAARKIVSRQVSFHDDMRIIHPAHEHVVLSRYMSAINGLMGAFHDQLVLRAGHGELDYAHGTFAMPEDIRARLEALVARYT
ncbi:hypothetical protein ASG11_11515 [Sphingomonas sp. Leaf357]|uniref:hypothetical protein n=1 Tax=Sphingomonas sp. Leaf357 TaxID=1736350 RepID=UPI0006F43554|nr:hypothetical protein [Sphingomonas sp. Leaf357]KQS04802.1 hypothetical protein ASG11_11515 [Sphingomonas sp. Leaf357]